MKNNNKIFSFIDDKTYINSSIVNNTTKPLIASFQTVFDSPLLDESNSYEYSMCIVRFSLPNDFPIFDFKTDKYYITLRYNNVDYTNVMTYNITDYSINVSERPIYNFSEFVDIMNNTLNILFNLISSQPGYNLGLDRPYFIIEDDKFSLLVPQSFENNVELFMNYDLYYYFLNTFKTIKYGTNRPDKKDIQFIIFNDLNNVPSTPLNYYKLTQSFSSLYKFYDITSIVFTTNMHVKSEQITTLDSNNKNIQLSILQDFIPDFSDVNRNTLIYNANPYRMLNIRNSDIRDFSFQVNTLDRYGNITPMMLLPNNNLTVKFMFEKKELINI